HLVEHLLGREVVNAEDDALAELAKLRRQALEDVMRRCFHLGQRGRFQFRPHGCVLARVPRRCIWLYKRAEVDGRRQNGERGASNGTFEVGGKMRAKTALTLLCMGLFSQFYVGAEAQTAGPGIRLAQAVSPDDVPPPRKRPPARLRVTPYYSPDG